jgi:fluoride ion exporter CrcB/FEX
MSDALDPATPDEPAPPEKFFHEGLTEREAWEKIRAEFRGWTAADRRMLWITIIGGLMVNVVTVLIIGLALLYAHATNAMSPHATELTGNIGLVVVFSTLALVWWGTRNGQRRAKFVLPLIIFVLSIISLSLVLGAIGSAAGLK